MDIIRGRMVGLIAANSDQSDKLQPCIATIVPHRLFSALKDFSLFKPQPPRSHNY